MIYLIHRKVKGDNMKKITIKEFYSMLTQGQALLIGHNIVKRENESDFEDLLLEYASTRLMHALNELDFGTYERKSFGAVSEKGSELRHGKGAEYFTVNKNMITSKIPWGDNTLYLTYAVK